MAAAFVIWAATLMVAQTPPTAADAPVSGASPSADDELAKLLPPARGRETVLRICAGDCHTAERVAGHTGDRDEWLRVLEDMALQGAEFTDDEQNEMVAYLASQLPPKVNINGLDEQQLQTELSLTAQEAAALVAWREVHGPFRSIEQLLSVPGVSAAKIEAARRQLIF